MFAGVIQVYKMVELYPPAWPIWERLAKIIVYKCFSIFQRLEPHINLEYFLSIIHDIGVERNPAIALNDAFNWNQVFNTIKTHLKYFDY